MRLPLIIGEVGLGVAGISALISYGVKATDLKNSVIEIENLEDKLKKVEEQEKLRKLLEEEERKKLEGINEKIKRLIKEVKNFFKENFPVSENKNFLDNLKLFWINSLDNFDNLQFEINLDLEKINLINDKQKNDFKSQYKKMKNLVELWQDLSTKTSDFQTTLRELHALFN